MLDKIKKRIDLNLIRFLNQVDASYNLNFISPLLFKVIKDFILRDGKRLRPILFVIGYKGFSKKEPAGLYTSALSIELLHDFMLVHDDIIDKSEMRRKKPSMHVLLNKYLARYPKAKFNGQDLSIVAGDIIYAIAIDAFLKINALPLNKERALKRFIRAAVYTGSGEFIELLSGTKKIEETTKEDIEKIYDYKTAEYTFSTPLATGALLAGASQREEKILSEFGRYLGRAFQVKDDILGLFSDEKKIGKSILSDLQEAKKTLVLWHIFNKSCPRKKSLIKNILSKQKVTIKDLQRIRLISQKTKSLDYARNEVEIFASKAESILKRSGLSQKHKDTLIHYCRELLDF